MKNFLNRLLEVVLIPLLILCYWCVAFTSLAIIIAIAPTVYLFTGIELVDMWIDTIHSIEDKFLENEQSMKKTKRKWSSYEERVVRTYVKKHPENLRYCFFLASKEIDRTPKAISERYYKYLKYKEGNFLFNIFSAFRSLVNIKNKFYSYGE